MTNMKTILDEKLEEICISKQLFSKSVEKIVFSGKGDISFIEATISVADYFGIELSEIKKYLTPEIQRKIEIEASNNNLIEKEISEETTIIEFFE